MKLKARQHVDHPRYGPGTTLEDGGKRTMVYFRNVGIRKFPTCSGRVALMVGQARLTKRLPLKTQQGNFCSQIGDWRNSPAKCCDSINTSARHGSCRRIDPAYGYIRLLKAVGLAWEIKTVSLKKLQLRLR